MKQETFIDIIKELTERMQWEVSNIIDCISDDLWYKCYCDMPLYKHVYHMLHSLDVWFINPRDDSYIEPDFHQQDLNNLDVISNVEISKEDLKEYHKRICDKIRNYLKGLEDKELYVNPENCEYTRFTLILAQYRHLHTHLGIIMGFMIADTGRWPRVLGLENEIPLGGNYTKFF